MSEDKPVLGIQMFIRHDNVLGDVLHVIPAQWSERDGRPIGCASIYNLPHLDDLEFGGYVSDYVSEESVKYPDWPYFHGSTVAYRDVHLVDARRAKVMADFLAKVERMMGKADAREHGDRFIVFAKAIGASKVWLAKGPDHKIASWPSKTDYVAYSVLQGRESYRSLIQQLRASMRDRLSRAGKLPVAA